MGCSRRAAATRALVVVLREKREERRKKREEREETRWGHDPRIALAKTRIYLSVIDYGTRGEKRNMLHFWAQVCYCCLGLLT